jgi:DNA-binding NarL/FixJ family response regulator
MSLVSGVSTAMRAAPHRRNVDAVTAGRRVVIAEDSVLLLAGLTKLLESAGFEVAATAADAAGLLAAVERELPDVVIADVRMPPTHTDEGIRAALVIRSQWPDIAVLVLSQYVEERYAADLLSANTHGIGYLLKDRVADVAEFLDALRRVAAGGTALDPEVVAQLLVRRGGDPLDHLTDRERDVLALMAEGRSNAEIAATLVITDSAVSKHINSIFAKLGLYPHDAGHRRVLAVLRYLGVDPALRGGVFAEGARCAVTRAVSRHSGTACTGLLRHGCRGGEDHEADDSLHREHAQDQLVAQLLAPAEQRRRRGRAAAVLDLAVLAFPGLAVGHERAAAQAAPGCSAHCRCRQPVSQVRFVRRIRHVPLAGTASRTGSSPQIAPLGQGPFPALTERRLGAQIHVSAAGLRRSGPVTARTAPADDRLSIERGKQK